MVSSQPRLRIAVIGAGPAGLAAAIEFAKLPFLREIGTGISIQRNTWRLLDAFGLYDNIDPETVFRAADGHAVQHRNGRTGELLSSHGQSETPLRHQHARALRSVLQQALLKTIDPSRLRLSSRLVEITETVRGIDLLVGADRVRSVVRQFAFSDHRIAYTAKIAYRALVDAEKVLSIPNFPDAVIFWHGPKDWVYTCNLNQGIYEVREVKKFALFAGPPLATLVSCGSIALVGDASHPLSGAFGDGAGFALEDVFVLVRAIEWAHTRGRSIREALNLYDLVRSPYYKSLYAVLDGFRRSDDNISDSMGFDDAVFMTVTNKWEEGAHWMYHYDVRFFV
ncbi:FAD/NAD(P)-binding domain-containing protein [Aspergillus heteromorphus CBS 117.55]|uniref:FAD/NAD(P)-binding domain-containing protein n=1 Tax=Aspergillus heteromorphus CBS 117.55 TaxID=1448321 RepID=A0A317VJK4_9EURO|nr:FAD/NAD(P)-binding domain-containing protein [Aspergillus heteromorphus CBS 117.55]PWY73032.1 FAD/NAD(P)-binding domain-containing protein [Aspergillus heteromorphus CBS 117.55]